MGDDLVELTEIVRDKIENYKTMQTIQEAYILSKKNHDGSPGKPVGISALDETNEDGAMLLFEDLAQVRTVMEHVMSEMGELSIFKVSVTLLGEVVA